MDFDDEIVDIAERSSVRTSQSWAGEGAPWLVDGRSHFNVENSTVGNAINPIKLYFPIEEAILYKKF